MCHLESHIIGSSEQQHICVLRAIYQIWAKVLPGIFIEECKGDCFYKVSVGMTSVEQTTVH